MENKIVALFASFESKSGKSDRMQIFHREQNAKDLFDWVDKNRKELERLNQTPFTVLNCKIIR